MKDHEIDRIAAKLTQNKPAKTVITSHNDTLRQERLTVPERFKKTGFGSLKNTEMASAQALSQTKKGFKKGANPNKTNGGNEATTFAD